MSSIDRYGDRSEPAATQRGECSVSTVFVIEPDPAQAAHLQSQLASMGVARRLFSSADEYWRSYDSRLPGCLILDVHATVGGVYLRDRLAQEPLAPPMIYLSTENDVSYVVNVMRQGAVDFLQRRTYGETDLWDAIQRAFHVDTMRRADLGRRNELLRQLRQLSAPELQVLVRLASGKNNREIADELAITRAAVEGRRTRLMKKIGLVNVVSLVRFAIEIEADPEADKIVKSIIG